MRKAFFIVIALLAGSVCAACHRLETANGGGNNAAAPVSEGKTAAAEWGNARQSNREAEQGQDLLLPAPAGFVNDYARVIDERTKARLEELLGKLKERGQIEFALATLNTTGAEDIDQYSLTLARSWGIGTNARGANGGLLLLVAVQDRKWRIQVSRSLETTLPDSEVEQIGRLMNEPFRAGRYGEGLTKCVEAFLARLSERGGFTL